MRVRTSRFSVVALAVAAAATLAVAAPASARHGWSRHHWTPAFGTWITPVGDCIDNITNYDPVAGTFTCTGGDEWTGSLAGHTTWKADAKFDNPSDPVHSGLTSHQVEVFTGATADGRTGTLTFDEQIVYASVAGGAIDVRARIVAGTGQLAGLRGHLRFVGNLAADSSGTGPYFGWLRERHGRR